MSSIKNINSKFDLIASRVKYGTDGGINVDGNALFVNALNGRVGINTISPQANLDVSGFLRTNSNISSSTTIDISGYYRQNGTPINNSFYPALNSSSFGVNAISSWQLRSHVNNKELRGCCWSPERNLFVVVSSTGTNDRVLTSPDGITWTTRDTSGADLFWRSVCWSPERSKFIAVASSGLGQRVLDSSDGITWVLRTTPIDNEWTSVIWARELSLFVAVSQTGSGNRVMTSPDGITWTSRTSASDIQWRSVCWSKELSLLVAVSQTGSGSRVMTSPDGITWTSRSTPEDIDYQSVCWSSELGLFVAVAGTGSNGRVITSLDGINWTLRSSILSYWNSVVWSPQLRLFVAVSQSGTRLMYSSNGINWSGISLDTFINYNSLCWSSELGLFIYVGERNSSATTLIATSSLNGRPPTSYNVFDSSFNSINQLGLWNFQSFGRGSPVTKTGDFVVQPGENWIVVNYSLATLITLPAASSWPGREIMIKTLQNSVISASSNVVPLGSTTPGTTLLSAGGKWCTIVSDGTNWIVMLAN